MASLGLNQTSQLHAQQIVEHAAEQRLQLSFHVNDGALAKFLPYEWTSAITAEGANKDVNARLVLLPPHDPQFRRNRERVVRDAERENFTLEWDLGFEEADSV
jgi:hypothetical protein